MLFIMATVGHRGLWVRASSAASPDSIPEIISLAEEMGITDIYYQAVVGGYAYYRSELLPRSQYLTRLSGPDYDPLERLTAEAHARGIRVHAWVNSLLVWSGEEPPESTSHIFYRHPEWSVKDVLGRAMFGYSQKTWSFYGLDGLFVDPALPDVRAWLAGVCLEIAMRYPVDGIQLDFIRYPGTWWGLPEREESSMFSLPESEELRWMELVRYPTLPFSERYKVWHFWRLNAEREASVYEAVRAVSDTLRSHPATSCLRLSAAVWANPPAAGFRVAQSWWRWEGAVDYLAVMSYTQDTGTFSDYLDFALSVRPEAVFGIGFLWPNMEAEAREEEATVLSRGGAGVSFFDYTRLVNEVDRDKLLGKKPAGEPRKSKESLGAIRGAFSDPPPRGLVGEGRGLLVAGEDEAFGDWLLRLSADRERDLKRLGLTREAFYENLRDDVAAFKALDMAIFPVGDVLLSPPGREISFAFLPFAGEDPEAVKKRAKDVKELPLDTIIYPKALDPLAKAVFSAKRGKREICLAPDGVYVFEVKREISAGKKVRRKDTPRELLPVYLGWTIKARLDRALR